MKSTKRKGVSPDFISKSDLAKHIGCDIHTIDRWVATGKIPPPHSRLGERYSVWLMRHYEEYVRTKHWPEEAYPRQDS